MIQLITNLDYVTLRKGGVEIRTHCSALLLEPATESGPMSGYSGCEKVRGFGPDGAWPVFDLVVDVDDIRSYKVEDRQSNLIVLGNDGNELPQGLCSLTWEDGTELILMAEDGERPFCFEDAGERCGDELWALLQRRAADFWNAPFMPHLQWGPANPSWAR